MVVANAVVVALTKRRLVPLMAVDDAYGNMLAVVEVDIIFPAMNVLPWTESAEPGDVVPIPRFPVEIRPLVKVSCVVVELLGNRYPKLA